MALNRPVRQLGVGVVAVVLGYKLVPLVSRVLTDSAPIPTLNDPLAQFGLVSVLAYVALSAVVGALWPTDTDDADTFSTIDARTRPDYVDTEWEVSEFGVDWTVLHGKKRGREGLYAYAAGPYCPDCGAELRTRTEPRRLRRDEELWNCRSCNFSEERPTEYLGKEKDVVETYVEREVPRHPRTHGH